VTIVHVINTVIAKGKRTSAEVMMAAHEHGNLN